MQERLERMAAEKAAAERERREKAEKRKAEKATRAARPRSSPASTGRTRIVWAVCNHMGDVVKTFSYPEKEQADGEAARLSEDKGRQHYVRRHTVPME